MQLSELERERLAAILEKYDRHPEVQRMREFIQHGDVTTYQHCKNVVLVSFWLNRRFHLGADETALAVGGFVWPTNTVLWWRACSSAPGWPTRMLRTMSGKKGRKTNVSGNYKRTDRSF